MENNKNIEEITEAPVEETVAETVDEVAEEAMEIEEAVEEVAYEAFEEVEETSEEMTYEAFEEVEEISEEMTYDFEETANEEFIETAEVETKAVKKKGAEIDMENYVYDPESSEKYQELEKKEKKKGFTLSYERRKSLYGYGFIALWAVGTIYFFILPVITSLIYSFHNTAPKSGYMEMEFVGIQNYVDAFRKDPKYATNLGEVLGSTALKTPLIIIFSIFIAVILNQKFRGRTIARAIFFLPVIIATGPVYDVITGNMSTGGYAGGSEQFSSMFETNLVDQLLTFLGIYNLPEKITSVISTLTDEIFNMVWFAGIQILLFLSALQNIPTSAKEAAQMEGATAWEYFWKITVPYISPMVIAALVYTVVDSFVDPTNAVMQQVLSKASDWKHGYSAAMGWTYFAIIGVLLAIVVVIVNKFVYYEVE